MSYSQLSFCVIVGLIICLQIINARVSDSWNDFQDYWQLDFVLQAYSLRNDFIVTATSSMNARNLTPHCCLVLLVLLHTIINRPMLLQALQSSIGYVASACGPYVAKDGITCHNCMRAAPVNVTEFLLHKEIWYHVSYCFVSGRLNRLIWQICYIQLYIGYFG